MEDSFKPSIRKQFLERVYQRNLITQFNQLSENNEKTLNEFHSINSSSFISQDMIPSVEPIQEIPKQTKTHFHNRSKTPLILSRSSSQSSTSLQVFHDFLTDLLKHKENIPQSLLSKTSSINKVLSEHFSNNPNFSMNLYLALTGILKYLKDPLNIDPDSLSFKVTEALLLLPKGQERVLSVKESGEKLNLKVINSLKRSLSTNETIVTVFNAFLVLFTEIEKNSEKIPLKKIQGVKVLEIMQKYLQTPGKMIQICRKFQEFFENNEITEPYVKCAEGMLKGISDETLADLDPSGGLSVFYEYLKSCVQYFNDQYKPMSQISLMKVSSQESLKNPETPEKLEKYSKLDEALELSKELLKISPKTSTPLKEQHKKILKKCLNEKLKEFLKTNSVNSLWSFEDRIMLYEKFERSVSEKIRLHLVLMVIDYSKFSEQFLT